MCSIINALFKAGFWHCTPPPFFFLFSLFSFLKIVFWMLCNGLQPQQGRTNSGTSRTLNRSQSHSFFLILSSRQLGFRRHGGTRGECTLCGETTLHLALRRNLSLVDSAITDTLTALMCEGVGWHSASKC